MDKSEIQKLLKERERRDKLKAYKEDFSLFAQEQVKIITKDANQGFIPFALNECQKRITEALDKQISDTGKVRAIIL